LFSSNPREWFVGWILKKILPRAFLVKKLKNIVKLADLKNNNKKTKKLQPFLRESAMIDQSHDMTMNKHTTA